ncbi:MAG: 8-amino-7-oxononanoate synthase [Bacteroidota bacterium]
MILFPKKLEQQLNERKENDLLRSLPGQENLVDFASNDYLGFAQDETLYAHTFQRLLNEGISRNGASGSRLISGNHKLYTELEAHLAHFHDIEDALVFTSGYNANLGFFAAVPQRNDVVFYDQMIHASIRDGIALGHAKSYKFRHNDLENLQEGVQRVLNSSQEGISDTRIYVVTESVFSMEGDSPDLTALAKYCLENGYYLVVDEAHALGVFGSKGMGLVQELGLEKKVFARIITFGKALGCHGAAVLGSAVLKQFLLNFARSFMYTTGLPPHTLATLQSGYAYLESTEGKDRQRRLKRNITYFKQRLGKLDLAPLFTPSDSAIQACVIPGNSRAQSISKKLAEDGFNVKAIRSPSVPKGYERLRFCVHSFNTKEEIGYVLQLLKNSL